VTLTPALRGLLKRSITAALKFMKFEYPAEVSVTAVDDESIRELNRDWRGKDKATDVLSFPMCECGDWELTEDGFSPLGDIVLSLERCLEQSEKYGHSFERELSFLTVHSVLHLLGYDHETSKEDEEEMFSLQKQIMEKIKL
jgi:probable rRNA maturation factor